MDSVPISVLLVEDHSLLRMGIKASLSKYQSISIIGEASNGAEAINKVTSLKPDVVLMDLSMPIMDGLESARMLRKLKSDSKIIILSSHQEDSVVQSAFESGVRGYLSKDIQDDDQLCDAIRTVYSGEIWIDPSITGVRFKSTIDQNGCLPEFDQSATIATLGTLDSDLVTQNLHGLSSKFEYLNFLGRGGMSVVHKVKHRLLDKVLAVKFMSSALCSSESLCKRFIIEARVTSQLSHPNIVSTHDYGIAPDGQPYLVMDYAEGPTIAEALTANGKVSESEARPVFRQIAAALRHAHLRGVIHRDVKPANVILTRSDDGKIQAKLLDFGLAKTHDSKNQNLTQTGQCLGSPLYMSPEQCRTNRLDERSDVYSFGCLMYEVLCGHPPFYGNSPFDTMHMHVNDEPAEPDAALCSVTMKKILEGCLHKDPAKRLSSAELVEIL